MPHVDLPQAEFKVVLLGDTFTGKTSLVLRFAEGYYRESARSATVGAFFITKRLTVPSVGLTCKIQIWDTAGQEQFKPLAPMYYSNSAAAILCYDPASPKSLETLKYWLDELHRNVPAGRIVIALAACKCDLLKQEHNDSSLAVQQLKEVEELAAQMGAIFVPTSAKNNENVTELFSQVAERVLQFQKTNKGNHNPTSSFPVTLGTPPTAPPPTTHNRLSSTTRNGIGLVPRPDNHHHHNSPSKDDYLHRRSHHITNSSLPQPQPPSSPSRHQLTDPNKMNESPITLHEPAYSPTNNSVSASAHHFPHNNPAAESNNNTGLCGDTDYLNSCALVPGDVRAGACVIL